MAYLATVIPVMIASPGDVQEERNTIRKALYSWNDVNSKKTQMILNPIGWETHGAPEMGESAQAIINKRLLTDCDLLIAVFWTRLGTPTQEYLSGTVEEIERHMAENKPTMLYFSNKPIAYSQVDREQYDLLNAKKSEWKSQGRIEEYSTLEEFKEKLNKQLPYIISHHEYLTSCSMPKAANKTQLSETATEIIILAGSSDGTIMKIAHLAGLMLHIGGTNLDTSSPRKTASYTSALNELIALELIEAKSDKMQRFDLTNKGWEMYDLLNTN